jgi:hypothetical protein
MVTLSGFAAGKVIARPGCAAAIGGAADATAAAAINRQPH